MLYSGLFFIHIVITILLGLVILMQSGRGGGLTEAFASAESMFGAKTNAFMVKTTTVLIVCFIVTSTALTYLSSQKKRSLMPTTIATPQKIDHTIEIPLTDEKQAAKPQQPADAQKNTEAQSAPEAAPVTEPEPQTAQ